MVQTGYVRMVTILHLKRTSVYLLLVSNEEQCAGPLYPEGNPIFLLVPPNIAGGEQNVSVLIGQAVELLCQSDAVPSPTLTWLKDGRPLLRKPGLGISENGSVLTVRLTVHLLLLSLLLILSSRLQSVPY